ncbi:iron-siderophore ABC transporter substrate-binding protein [Pistricoccus aurantiacus]|uniref:iron-siderophore ABC transporter substrate-binding protein n=1 Tax=Pistricoccus aurantiacus TaxID=1883414 RepID=UPI0036260F09
MACARILFPLRLGLAWLVFLTLLCSGPALAKPRIATLDWALAETLLGIGVTPLAMASPSIYNVWVGEPRAPQGVQDIGLRNQPNLEQLAALEPDAILMSPRFSSLEPQLSRVAPVHQLGLYNTEQDVWPALLTLTRRLGEISNSSRSAETLIDNTRALFATWRKRLAPYRDTPLLIVQFSDDRHLRVFGDHGLFQVALDRLGLTNAWQGDTNAYGFAVIDLEELATIEAHIVIVEPLPAGVETALAHSGLWQRLIARNPHGVDTLPETWSFGALPSLQRFTRLLGQLLTTSPRDA